MVNPYAQYLQKIHPSFSFQISILFVCKCHTVSTNETATTVWSGFWSFCWGLCVAGRWSWVWWPQMGYLHYSLMREREKQRCHIRWITLKYVIYSWLCPIKLPRIVIEGVSFPSLKSVSLSILEYGSLGFGSLGVPSTLAHLPMVLSQPTILFNTQLWSYRTHSQHIYCIILCQIIGCKCQTMQQGKKVCFVPLVRDMNSPVK